MADAKDYSKGIIYALRAGDDVYVGSTCLTIEERRALHIQASQSPDTKDRLVYQRCIAVGWQNVVIEELHPYPCTTKDELRMEEQRVMNEMATTLNIIRAFRTEQDKKVQDAQRKKAWIVANAEKEQERAAKYRSDNKEVIRSRILAWRAEKTQCEHCHASVSRGYLPIHVRTKHPNV